MAVGWIKLHRQIQDCELLWDSKNEPFDRRSAWIDLLLLANHRDKRILFRGKAITVKCGQRVTSLHKLSERWHWGINRVRNYLDTLQEEGMLIRESDNTRTLLTIVNYQKYQGIADFDETPTDTVTDTVTNTVTDTVTDTKQEINKNDKNKKKSVYGEYAHVRLTDPEHQKLIEEYGQSMTDACITYLDEYIEMKGYKAKSHYLCIRKWVVNAVNERKSTKKALVDTGYDESMEMLKKMLEG